MHNINVKLNRKLKLSIKIKKIKCFPTKGQRNYSLDYLFYQVQIISIMNITMISINYLILKHMEKLMELRNNQLNSI